MTQSIIRNVSQSSFVDKGVIFKEMSQDFYLIMLRFHKPNVTVLKGVKKKLNRRLI